MARLDDAGVHRADRNLVHAVAFDAHERDSLLARLPLSAAASEIAAQRKQSIGQPRAAATAADRRVRRAMPSRSNAARCMRFAAGKIAARSGIRASPSGSVQLEISSQPPSRERDAQREAARGGRARRSPRAPRVGRRLRHRCRSAADASCARIDVERAVPAAPRRGSVAAAGRLRSVQIVHVAHPIRLRRLPIPVGEIRRNVQAEHQHEREVREHRQQRRRMRQALGRRSRRTPSAARFGRSRRTRRRARAAGSASPTAARASPS